MFAICLANNKSSSSSNVCTCTYHGGVGRHSGIEKAGANAFERHFCWLVKRAMMMMMIMMMRMMKVKRAPKGVG